MELNGTESNMIAPLIESNNLKPNQHYWDPFFKKKPAAQNNFDVVGYEI